MESNARSYKRKNKCGFCLKEHSFTGRNRWFCSDGCSDSFNDRGGRPCKECGNIFLFDMTDTRKRYCSPSCRYKSRYKRRSAMNSLSTDWKHEVIVSLFNYECQICGISKKLHIHHIIPVSIGGRNHISNITVLCSKCHRNLHFGVFNKLLQERIKDD